MSDKGTSEFLQSTAFIQTSQIYRIKAQVFCKG